MLGKAIHTSPDALAFFADGRLYPLADSGDMTRSYVDSTGQHVHVTLVDNDPSGSDSQPTATPVVTCVTTTPDPSERQSAATSPFACGYKFDAPVHDSDGLSIASQKWISSTDAQNGVLDEFGGQWPASIPRPTAEVLTAHAVLSATMPNGTDPLRFQGGRDVSDPIDSLARQTDFATMSFFAGMTVVGVTDGEVVANVPESSSTTKWLYDDTIPRGNDPLGLSVLDASQALRAVRRRSDLGRAVHRRGRGCGHERWLGHGARLCVVQSDGLTLTEAWGTQLQVFVDQLLRQTHVRTRGEVGEPLGHVVGQSKRADERTDGRRRRSPGRA